VSQQLLVGFDFGGTKLATVLADLDGTRLAGEVLPTEAERGAEQAVRRAIAAARDLLSSRGAGVAAVGVATMGITRDDHVELAPNVPGWDRLALPQLLRDEFGSAPVAIANDVRAAAVAELTWGELRNVSTGIYVNLGTGFAGAMEQEDQCRTLAKAARYISQIAAFQAAGLDGSCGQLASQMRTRRRGRVDEIAEQRSH